MVFLNSVGQDLTVHRDIRADDLEVSVDGRRTRIVSLSLNSSPRRVIMMVDASGSMHPSPQRSGWGIALRTADFAFDSVPSNASVALLTFSDRIRGESDGFQDRQQIGKSFPDLAKREPRGSTALFDSVDQALSLFEAPRLGDAIYLVTDGVDDKSKVSLKKLVEKSVTHGVRIFVFLIPLERFLTEEERLGPSLMEELAESTGGYVIRVPWREIGGNEQAWVRSATQISDQMQAMYQIELDISGVVGSKGRVKVVFADRKRDKNTLTFPRQLTRCLHEP
jgi:hypothetical protein